MLSDTATTYFKREYPLVKLFKQDGKNVIYDAKPHFAFVLSDEELAVLLEVLEGTANGNTANIHSAFQSPENSRDLRLKFMKMIRNGVFFKGPLEEISPVDRDRIRNQLNYYKENILLRKFCLEVTENCNFRCTYCKRTIASAAGGHFETDLSEGNAFQGIRYYFGKYTSFFAGLSEEKQKLLLQIVPPALSWYGGEPFLNFDLIKKQPNTSRLSPGTSIPLLPVPFSLQRTRTCP